LAKAEASLGGGGVRAESIGNHREISIEKGDTLLMGIHLPRLRSKGIEQKFYERDFSFVGTPLIVDEMSNSFNRDIEGIIRLADGEIRLTKLLKEIFQTTRRLKALEHIVIPRLKAEYNYIRMILDERERAEHFSLKLAKKITQRKYKDKSQQSLSV
jgi:V/A-type H+-transporting ATPase subunit D